MPEIKLALITGATSGLGEALSLLLSEKRIPLFLTGQDPIRLQSVAARCQAESMPLDLRACRDPLIAYIRKHTPDLVINNAGFALYGPVLNHSTQSEMDILEVNAAAAMEITIEAARALLVQKRQGIILNVSSSAGELPIPSMAVYAAAKSFLTSFSKSFDSEMKPHGIRILTAIPGPIATPFAQRASLGRFIQSPSWSALSPERVAQKIWKQIASKKAVQIIDFLTLTGLWLAKLLPRPIIEWTLQKKLSGRYTLLP